MFHPWRALRALPKITVKWVHLSDKRALTNGVDVIWMDKSALQVERRCSLTHELIHIEEKHTSCQPLAIERKVRAEAARRLIPIGDLAAALAWAHSFHELADDLWVTSAVLADRISNLSQTELAILRKVEIQSAFALSVKEH
jgi:hypothetical protein